jgi:hypothetical protein
MKSIVAALTLAQIIVLGTTKTGTAMTAKQLLESCEILLQTQVPLSDGKFLTPQEGTPCFVYMDALQDVSALAYEGQKQPLVGWCAPENSNQLQLIKIFVDYARKNPARLHESGTWVAHAALSRAFPCR